MRWFGHDWGAAVNRDCAQGPAPLGAKCLFCPHTIRPGDNGVLLPDGHTGVESPAHIGCFLHSIGINTTKEVLRDLRKGRIQ
jgi:hypothetical protein